MPAEAVAVIMMAVADQVVPAVAVLVDIDTMKALLVALILVAVVVVQEMLTAVEMVYVNRVVLELLFFAIQIQEQ
jgi:hypothetical protein